MCVLCAVRVLCGECVLSVRAVRGVCAVCVCCVRAVWGCAVCVLSVCAECACRAGSVCRERAVCVCDVCRVCRVSRALLAGRARCVSRGEVLACVFSLCVRRRTPGPFHVSAVVNSAQCTWGCSTLSQS